MFDNEETPDDRFSLESKDGHTVNFYIEAFTPKKAMRWVIVLFKMVGGGLIAGDGIDQTINLALNGIDEGQLEHLINDMANKTRVQLGEGTPWKRLRDSSGSDGTFNVVFGSSNLGYGGMMQWLVWAFKFQFSGFLDTSVLKDMRHGLNHKTEEAPNL